MAIYVRVDGKHVLREVIYIENDLGLGRGTGMSNTRHHVTNHVSIPVPLRAVERPMRCVRYSSSCRACPLERTLKDT